MGAGHQRVTIEVDDSFVDDVRKLGVTVPTIMTPARCFPAAIRLMTEAAEKTAAVATAKAKASLAMQKHPERWMIKGAWTWQDETARRRKAWFAMQMTDVSNNYWLAADRSSWPRFTDPIEHPSFEDAYEWAETGRWRIEYEYAKGKGLEIPDDIREAFAAESELSVSGMYVAWAPGGFEAFQHAHHHPIRDKVGDVASMIGTLILMAMSPQMAVMIYGPPIGLILLILWLTGVI